MSDLARAAQVLGAAALGALAAGLRRRWPRDRRRRAGRRRRRRAPRHLGLRRSQISGRTSAISTTSIRRRRRAASFSQIGPNRQFNQNFLTFNSLNSYILKGDAAQGMELTFATLMARARDEPDAMYGLAARAVRISRRRPDLSLPAAAGGALPRRHAAHRARRRLLAQHPARRRAIRSSRSCCATSPAPKRRTTRPWSCASPRSARATCRCSSPACRSSRAPTIRRARSTRSTLDVPLGSGAYKVGRFEAGRYIEYERVKDWWGAEPAGRRAARTISTCVRFEYYRDRDVAFEGFTAKSYLFREEFTSRIWATRYDFPAIRDGRVKRDVLPDDTPSGAQGWFINTRRDKFKDRAPARGADLRLRLRMDQQEHHVRLLRAHPLGVPEFRHDGDGQAERGRSSRCSSRSAARCRTRCSASRSCRRSPTARARTARCCARRPQLLQEAGLRDQGRQARRCQGRAHHHRVPDRRADVPAAPHAVHQESRHARHRRDACASSIRCSTAPRVDDFDFDITVAALRLLDHAGRLAALAISPRRRRRLTGSQQSRRHRRSGDRRADRHDHRRRDAGRAGRPPAGRSTA